MSVLWIGHYKPSFVVFSTLLTVGWFLNTVCSAAYFINLGVGNLRWNTVSHVLIGVLNVALGFISGYILAGLGVVVAWTVSLIIGSLVIPVAYHRAHNIPIAVLIPSENVTVALASLVTLVMSLSLHHLATQVPMTVWTPMLIISLVLLLGIAVWTHRMRKRLLRLVTDGLMRESA